METQVETVGRIVVGTDGSPRADKAVEWAADRAVAQQLPLLVVYVLPSHQLMGSLAASVNLAYERGILDSAAAQVTELVESLRASRPGLEATSEAILGHPSFVLAEASKDAALVVVGARGASATAARLLGGVSDAVAAHAQGPIAVIGDQAEENPQGPVVVGVDEGEPAMAAVTLAFEAAERQGVPLTAVHSFTYGPSEATWDEQAWDPSGDEFKKSLSKWVLELLADQMSAHPGVQVDVRVERGRPQDSLVEASKGASLVVVGSRGRGGFKGLLLGSTSKHVLREAHCPVIVTRGDLAREQA